MVYAGKPPRGCQMRGIRSIKGRRPDAVRTPQCDETKPACKQCARLGRQYPGYRDVTVQERGGPEALRFFYIARPPRRRDHIRCTHRGCDSACPGQRPAQLKSKTGLNLFMTLGGFAKHRELGDRARLSGFPCGEDGADKSLAGYFLFWPLTYMQRQDYLTDCSVYGPRVDSSTSETSSVSDTRTCSRRYESKAPCLLHSSVASFFHVRTHKPPSWILGAVDALAGRATLIVPVDKTNLPAGLSAGAAMPPERSSFQSPAEKQEAAFRKEILAPN
ncbi:Uncharacterized protein TCAP_05640 [Tolypocladium capitatum]|uniref:Uncharacterized protein n=1 Tax=Tolypocladium capitatum TaxID=45235 RepID=A0A2K3QAA7_9HYPO|nr:Uncharacterized protein TCAP_05640 [Tolypocladium capitatum]